MYGNSAFQFQHSTDSLVFFKILIICSISKSCLFSFNLIWNMLRRKFGLKSLFKSIAIKGLEIYVLYQHSLTIKQFLTSHYQGCIFNSILLELFVTFCILFNLTDLSFIFMLQCLYLSCARGQEWSAGGWWPSKAGGDDGGHKGREFLGGLWDLPVQPTECHSDPR